MIDWLKLISSGLMDSLTQVSVLIFFFLLFPSAVAWIFHQNRRMLSAIRSQYDLGQTPRTGNQAAWHSLEVSRTVSPASSKFLCICKLWRCNVGLFSSTNGGTIWICKGWIGFSKSFEKSAQSVTFLFPCSLQDLVGSCNMPADGTRSF